MEEKLVKEGPILLTEDVNKNYFLEKELEEKEELLKKYFDSLQRLQADFENYKKRVRKEREDLIELSKESIISELLPIIDNFERSLEYKGKDVHNLKKGINLIFQQMNDFLKRLGVIEIATCGEKFNPEIHEAIMKEESTDEEGTILEEIQKGYKLNSRVIRPARVKVAINKKGK